MAGTPVLAASLKTAMVGAVVTAPTSATMFSPTSWLNMLTA